MTMETILAFIGFATGAGVTLALMIAGVL